MKQRRRLIKARRTLTGLLLVASISFIAGMTDGVGVILTGNFVSFMTGNTTRAAIALDAGQIGQAALLLAAILTFVAGNALGIVIAHTSDRRAFVVLSSVSIMLAGAALLSMPDMSVARFLLIVLAMGSVNATVEHVEGLPIGLTYVTGALSRFGRGIGRILIGDRDFGWTIQIVPWVGMVAGAIIGAMLATRLGGSALWVVAIVTLFAAVATMFIPRPLRRRFSQRISTSRPQQPRR